MHSCIRRIGKFSDHEQPQNHKTSQTNIDEDPTIGSTLPQQALRYTAMASVLSNLQQQGMTTVWDGATQTVGRTGGKRQNLPYTCMSIRAEKLNGGTYKHVQTYR